MSQRFFDRTIPLVLCSGLAGCASVIHETHYFRSVDRSGNPVNYYRVNVSGGTLLSSSRYLSGYFDEQAVNTYFNEYTQPDKAHFADTPAQPPAPTNPSALNSTNPGRKVESLTGSLNDRHLVLILSSNSDEIASGISSLAQSNDIASTLESIVSRDRTSAASKATSELKFDASRGKVLADKGTAVLAAIGDNSDRATVQPNLLRYAEDLATFLSGGDVRFASLQDASDWLRQHKSLLGKE